jgi:hypothetical protein
VNRLGGEVMRASTTRPDSCPSGAIYASGPWDASSRRRRSWSDSTLSATPCWGFRGEQERLDRRFQAPPPEVLGELGPRTARWAVGTRLGG